jgi:hypothetical protein
MGAMKRVAAARATGNAESRGRDFLRQQDENYRWQNKSKARTSLAQVVIFLEPCHRIARLRIIKALTPL